MKEEKKTHFNLSEDEMKSYGYKVIDSIVDHFINLRDKKPVNVSSRKELDLKLMENVPETGQAPLEVLDFVTKNIFSSQSHVNHPKFYSFVPSPSNFISVMADSLVSGFNAFSGNWKSSSGAVETEIVTINWLLKLFGMPVKEGGGLFVSGGSAANLTALACARHIKCGNNFSNAIIYFSNQTHSSVLKNLYILGFNDKQIRIIPSNSDFTLNLDLLKKSIQEDRENGCRPICVIANAGTTNCGVVDPLNEIASIAKKENLWMHIDAAYGGAAILDEEGKQKLSGIEKADSVTVDPHKWFFQPYEIGCLLIKDGELLRKTFEVNPEYLRDALGHGGQLDFYNYGIQLTRSFRALKLYMSIKTYGLSTFRNAVSKGIETAEKAQKYLEEKKNWEIISPASLAILNFRYFPSEGTYSEKDVDNINHFISQKIFSEGEAMLATTILHKKIVLRMCLINPSTEFEGIKETIQLCEKYALEFIQ